MGPGPGTKRSLRGSTSSKDNEDASIPAKRTRRSLAATGSTLADDCKSSKKVVEDEDKEPSLSCLYCRTYISLPSVNPHQFYIHHLQTEHKIQYDIEFIVERTLNLQGLQAEQTQEAFVVVKTEPKEEAVEDIKSSPIVKPDIVKKSDDVIVKRTVPWFAGCEYICKECGQVEFYHEDLRAHIRKDHGDPDDYLDKYKQFETKSVWFECQLCKKTVRRHYTAMYRHFFMDHHRMKLETYRKKFNIEPEYEISVSVDCNFFKETPPVSATTDDQPAAATDVDDEEVVEETASAKSDDPSPSFKSLSIKLKRIEDLNGAVGDTSPAALDDDEIEEEVESEVEIEEEDEPLPPPKVKIVHQSPTLPWYLGCEFKCRLCQKMFYDVTKLLFHIKTKHDITAKPYLKRFSKLSTKLKFYTCLVCKTKVKHQKSSIIKHLSRTHQMKLDAYTEVFHPDAATADNSSQPDIRRPSSTVTSAASVTAAAVAPTPMSRFVSWSRGSCRYQCLLCREVFTLSAEMWDHAKAVHGKDPAEYKKAHGHPGITINELYCKGCSAYVDHDTTELMRHAKVNHNLTLRQLYLTFFEDEDDQGPPPQPPAPAVAAAAPTTSSQQATPDSVKRTSEYKNYEAWAAQCIYACKICSAEYRSDCSLIKHVKANHGIDKWEYKASHGKLVTRPVHFKCPSCSVSVLHAVNHLSFHIKRCLGIQLFQYYKDHIVGNKPTKASQLPQHASPGPKSSKVSLLPGTDKASKMYNKALRVKQKQADPEYDEWSNKCAYDCRICNNQYRCDAGLIKHVKNEHGMDKLDYKATYGKFVTKPVYFKCPYCSVKVLHVTNHLGFHIKRCGNMQLYEFYLDHIVGNKPVVKKAKEFVAPQASTAARIMAPTPPPASAPIQDQNFIQELNVWASQCEYACQICGQVFDQDPLLLRHIQAFHQMAKEDYKAQYGSFLSKKVVFNCPKCKREVFQTKKALAFHAKYCANLSVEDYYRKFVKGEDIPESPSTIAPSPHVSKVKAAGGFQNWINQCSIQCQVCAMNFTNDGVAANHIRSAHGLELAEYKAQHGELWTKVVHYSCPVCKQQVMQSAMYMGKHIRNCSNMSAFEFYNKYVVTASQQPVSLSQQLAVDQWLDKCKFTCKICNKEFTSRQVAFKHVGSSHNMDMASYITAHGYMLSHRKHFRCTKCQSDVLHERNVMTNHLQKCQKMSPSDYYQAHVTVPEQASKSQQKTSATATSSVQSEGGVSPFDDWIFAQKFVCLLCPDKFKFPSQLSHHLRGKHNLSKEEYQELKKSMPKNPVKEHRCCLCSRNVVQNYVELAKHFKLSHANVTVKDYYENHIANKGSTSTGEEDNRPPRYQDDVMEWANKCVWKCPLCPQASSNKEKEITNHIWKFHKGGAEGVSNDTMDPVILTDVSYSCAICGSVLRHDYKSLQAHISQEHNLTMRDYHRQHIKKDRFSHGPPKPPGLTGSTKIVASAAADLPPVATTSQPRPSLSVGSGAVDSAVEAKYMEWKDQCEYVCQVCNESVKMRRVFRNHINTKHMPVPQYIAQFGRLESGLVTHDCAVCGATVAHDSHMLQGHIGSIHRMSLKDYFVQYINSQQMAQIESTASDKTTWMNQCEFKCAICNSVFTTKSMFCQHLASQHGTNYDAYGGDYGSPLSVSKVHTCLICRSMVMCESEALEAHLRKIHQLTLDQYHQQHILKSTTFGTKMNAKSATAVNIKMEAADDMDLLQEQYFEEDSMIEMNYDNDEDDMGEEEYAFQHQQAGGVPPLSSQEDAAYPEEEFITDGQEEALVDQEMAENIDIVDEFNCLDEEAGQASEEDNQQF